MTNILANSNKELDQINDLLGKKIPSYRQAYSDRTTWLMACLSELAYIKFNPPSSSQKQIAKVEYNHDEEKEKLKKELTILKIELLETFDSDGTQAILVSNDTFIALSFRGTEMTSIKDIKADMKAQTMPCITKGKIHTGFNEAFDKVALDIQEKLNDVELKDKPLFITGHSLGGALATIATKKLSHKGGIAACYTFGSPRVGNDKWVTDIKTPIYRLVNAADCVTMLPPSSECITLLTWIMRGIAWLMIPFISQLVKLIGQYLQANFGGYLHAGNMRYMTNCKKGQYSDVKLLYSVSRSRRIIGWFIKKLPWKKFLADHSISIYRKKLMVIAKKRNQTI